MLIPGSTEYLYIVRSQFAEPTLENAWNEWYTGIHIPEMLSVPGIVTATRYRELAVQHQYVAMYEIEDLTVFSHDRYLEIAGWHDWLPYLSNWTKSIVKRVAGEKHYA